MNDAHPLALAIEKSKEAEKHLRHGESEAALKALREAIELAPGQADLHYNLGCALAQQGEHSAACDAFQDALALRPQDAGILNNLGNSLMESKRNEAADLAFLRALKYKRNDPLILENRTRNLTRIAAMLRAQNQETKALALLKEAVTVYPRRAENWYNLGTLHFDLGDLSAAHSAILEALRLREDYPLAHSMLGHIALGLRQTDIAIQHYQHAMTLEPDSSIHHWNLALAQLHAGELENGFQTYEWRFKLPDTIFRRPSLPEGIPRWQGESLAGKRVLLFCEQGFGDSLQFIRYLPMLAAEAAVVSLQGPSALHPLFKQFSEIEAFYLPEETPENLDYALSLMSLPAYFHTGLTSIPCEMPYLKIAPERERWWQSRLPHPRRPRVGLVWAGEPRSQEPDAHRIDRRRSLSFDDFSPLLDRTDIDFFSLQKGLGIESLRKHPAAHRVIDWSDDFTDFQETGALILGLDLIIGVDTAVIHLAAALQKPTWVLSRFDGCWRWQGGNTKSPWYPTLRLFWQARLGDWGSAIHALVDAFQTWEPEP